jgi:hypothetical protein
MLISNWLLKRKINLPSTAKRWAYFGDHFNHGIQLIGGV